MLALTRLLCVAAICLTSEAIFAQAYPVKPVRLVLLFPTGGSSDLVARAYAPKLGDLLGQQVIVDYKGGAGGSIGTAEVAKAAADGYTVLQVWDTHAVNHYLYKTSYDYLSSFEPVSLLVQAPGILVAHPAFPASTVKELVDYAKANPNKVTYGSSGSGSSNHLSGVLFSELADVKMSHVPYKGGGPLITDLLGGHIDIVFGTIGLFEPYVRSGKLKAIAVLSAARIPRLPNVPSAAETLPGFEAKTWFALLAPAGTPKPVVARLHEDVVKALNDEKVKEQLSSRGFDVVASTPEELGAFMKAQSETLGALIRRAGIKLE